MNQDRAKDFENQGKKARLIHWQRGWWQIELYELNGCIWVEIGIDHTTNRRDAVAVAKRHVIPVSSVEVSSHVEE